MDSILKIDKDNHQETGQPFVKIASQIYEETVSSSFFDGLLPIPQLPEKLQKLSENQFCSFSRFGII
jgi:hypothetical protein